MHGGEEGRVCRLDTRPYLMQVDAVWPGWGHASENPKLPAKLKEIGITFIGPPSDKSNHRLRHATFGWPKTAEKDSRPWR